jgi:tetratricopeptide (TPR) repeat protein
MSFSNGGSWKYLYERLGAERFQQLCNALLVQECPGVQCFPVGQKDGGRDAVRHIGARSVVYQVKWTKNSQRDPVAWLDKSIRDEADNIRRLVSEGAEAYYLLTNVPGTASPGSGTMDRLDQRLRQHADSFGVAMRCWWQADIDARVDAAPPELKRAYPEMLVGSDSMRIVRDSGGPEGHQYVSGPVTLPAGPENFTGRDSLLRELLERLDPSRDEPGVTMVSAVDGMGGVGKTALAVQAARMAYDRGWFPGGALFLNMRGFSIGNPIDYGTAAAHLLRGLRVPESDIPAGAEDRRAAWLRILAELAEHHRPLLAVLDNTAYTGQVKELLPPGPPHRMLITSRSILSSLPGRRVIVEPFPPDEAVRFIDGALRAASPGDDRAVVNSSEAYHLAELCGYLPLALRVVVALLRDEPGRPLASLSAELADASTRIDRLRYDDMDVDEQGQPLAVRAAFDLSYRYLADSPNHARAFRLLTTVPGVHVSKGAAAAAFGLAAQDARRLLADLARRHWLESLPGERWGMHDLVRLYAGHRAHDHADEDGREDAVERVFGYFRSGMASAALWLRSYGKVRPNHPGEFESRADAMAWLDREHRGLVAAVTAASETRRWDDAYQLAADLSGYQELRYLTEDGITVAALGLAAARYLGRDRECAAETQLGNAYRLAGRYTEAVAHLEHALRVRPADDTNSEGPIQHNLGLAYLRSGRFTEAAACHRRDLYICQESGDWRGAGEAMVALGDALQELKRFREATSVLNTAVEMFEFTGDLRNILVARTNLALTCMKGFPDTRAAYIIWQLCMALKAARDIDDRKGQVVIFLNLATAYRNRCQGCHGRSAAEWYQRAADLLRELGDSAGEIKVTYPPGSWQPAGYETDHEGCPGVGIPGSADLRAWLEDLPNAVLRRNDSRLDEARFFGNFIIGPTPDGSPLPDQLLSRNKTGLFITAEDLTGEESARTLGNEGGVGDEEEARAIGAEMGHDRGAVVMAAAFLRRKSLSVSAFLERLRDTPLDDDYDCPHGRGVAGAAKMAALAIETVERAVPQAGCVLDLLSLLAPGSIDARRLAPEFFPCEAAEIDAVVHSLADMAVIIVDGNEITVNPAAARTARNRAVRRGTILDAAAGAVQVLGSEISSLEGTVMSLDRLAGMSQQIDAVWAAMRPELAGKPAQDVGTWGGAAGMMRLRAWQVNFLAQTAGRPGDAVELGSVVLDDCQRLLGESHQETWRARNNLAGAHSAVGDFDQACALFTQNLRSADTGADDNDRLLTRHNLGVMHEQAGRPRRAARILAEVLADRERVLGARHPATLETRQELGVAYAGMGNLSEATRLLEESTEGRRSLGPASVDLAGSLDVLANLYAKLGLTDDVLRVCEESAAIKETAFGPGNINVILAHDELAELYMKARRFKKASILLKRNLADAEQSHGLDAEITHMARQHLRYAQRRMKNSRSPGE